MRVGSQIINSRITSAVDELGYRCCTLPPLPPPQHEEGSAFEFMIFEARSILDTSVLTASVSTYNVIMHERFPFLRASGEYADFNVLFVPDPTRIVRRE